MLNVFLDLALDGGGGLHVALASFGLFGKNVVAEGALAYEFARTGNLYPFGGTFMRF